MCEDVEAIILPKQPGIPQFDFLKRKFHKNQCLTYRAGVPAVKTDANISHGNVDCIQFDMLRVDAELTYGPAKKSIGPPFRPHYVTYDRACLRFLGFFRQPAFHTPHEKSRVRTVHLLYFLDDDTITLIEPAVPNSGLPQGRLVRRSRIPLAPPPDCEYLHWKDLNVGVDVELCGFQVHIVNCDPATREFLTSQGVEVLPPETVPPDEYSVRHLTQPATTRPSSAPTEHKLKQFLQYDGVILRFGAVSTAEDGVVSDDSQDLTVWFYLSDNTIQVSKVPKPNSGCDPFRLILKRTKLPKQWHNLPVTYPSVRDEEVTLLYGPRDLIVGEILDVYGTHILLTDCDHFTRRFYHDTYNITQPEGMKVKKSPPPPPARVLPPYTGFGELQDSLQSCLKFIMHSPRKDIVRKIVNANQILRYSAKLDTTHPEDVNREFVLQYSLADGTVSVMEPPLRNSGHVGGRFLSPMLVAKPGSDPDWPTYYTPQDFAIGSVVVLNAFRFIITGADLHVYNYMEDNPEKFRPEVVASVRAHFAAKGLVKEPLPALADPAPAN